MVYFYLGLAIPAFRERLPLASLLTSTAHLYALDLKLSHAQRSTHPPL